MPPLDQKQFNKLLLDSFKDVFKFFEDLGYKYDFSTEVVHDFQRIAQKMHDVKERIAAADVSALVPKGAAVDEILPGE